MTMSNEEFMTSLRAHMTARGLNPTTLGRQTGVGRDAMRHWIAHGIKNEGKRMAIVTAHPQLFGQEATPEAQQTADVSQKADRVIPEETMLAVRLFQLSRDIPILADDLEWFIVQSSVRQRECLRILLGGDLRRLYNAVAGNLGETAREIALQQR